MKNSLLLVLAALVLLVACSSEDKVINNYTDQSQAIAIVKDSPDLKLIRISTGELINSNLLNQSGLSGPPSAVKSFRNMLYVLYPKDFKVFVYNIAAQKLEATIDFSTDKIEPYDICFANATDAYICHANSNIISLIDITVYKEAKKINVGKNPVSIACSGNQIITANSGDNTVSFVDTRTNSQIATANAGFAPYFVDVRTNGKEFVVVSLGDGKIIDGKTKTASTIHFFDVLNKNNLGQFELATTNVKSIDFFPKSLSVSAKDWAFIPGDSAFLRVDFKSKTKASYIGKLRYNFTSYDIISARLFAVESINGKSTLKICDQSTGKLVSSIALPDNVAKVYPL